MPEEFDYSEMRKYLQGQIDMGVADVYFDEPWALSRPKRGGAPAKAAPAINAAHPAAPAINIPRPAASIPQPAPANNPPAEPAAPSPAVAPMAMPSARPVVQKAASAFESAESLEGFYTAIASDPVYANVSDLARYEGPENPKLLLLFDAPLQGVASGAFLQNPVGEMLVRLFANLNIPAESIGVAYFYKGRMARNIPALLETTLKKMLAKELSFIAPQVMATFGEPLFHRLFGKAKVFNDLAGTDLEFSGVKTCSLVDAAAMSQDKQLKWLTWKVHIPKSSYFKA